MRVPILRFSAHAAAGVESARSAAFARWAGLVLLGAVALLAARPAAALIVDVTIDTTGAVGLPATAPLAFELFDGDFVANNSVTVSGFSSTLPLPAPSDEALDGGASGGPLPANVTVDDSDQFLGYGHYRQSVALGGVIEFALEFTPQSADPVFLDTFSVILLDPNTADPTDAFFPFESDALFNTSVGGALLEIAMGSGQAELEVFADQGGTGATWSAEFRGVSSSAPPLPEPPTMLLLGAGLLVMGARHRRSRLRHAA